MKNIIKNSLVVVMLLSTLFVSANSNLRVENEDFKTTISLNNLKEGNKIFIKDASGSILYSETIKTPGNYNKSFDLTTLPNGDYLFEINKGLEINTILFNVRETVVAFEKENEKVIYKPYVTVDKNLVRVSKLSLEEKPLQIEIFFDDNGYNLIHTETVGKTKSISRVYSLNKAKKGNYKIVTRTEGRTFVDYVSL